MVGKKINPARRLAQALRMVLDSDVNISGEKIDAGAAREIMSGLLNWAGKSRDDVLQVVAHEFGAGFGKALKEPILEALLNRHLTINITLSPSDEGAPQAAKKSRS